MKKIHILLFIAILFYSCNKNKNVLYEYKFKEVKNIILPLSDTIHNSVIDAQLIKNDTANLLYVYTKGDYIYVYNLDTKKLEQSIPLKKGKPLLSFNVQSKDSIFVLYNSGYYLEYTDSILQLIDEDGDIRRVYGFDNKSFKSIDNEVDKKDMYTVHTIFHRMPYKNGKLYFLISKYYSYQLGDSLGRAAKIPPAGYINTKTGELNFINFPFFFPPKGYYYPQAYSHYFISLAHNGNPLLLAKYSNLIMEYNVQQNKLNKHYLKSFIVDTITPEKDKSKCGQLKFRRNQGSLRQLFYDKYRNIYIRPVLLPQKQYDNYTLVIADTNFNKLGEGVLPQKLVPSTILFSKKNILFWNLTETYKNAGKLVFTQVTIEKDELNKQNLIDSLNLKIKDSSTCTYNKGNVTNNSISKFLKKYLKEKTYAILIVPYMYSCPSCKKYAVLYYSLNKERFFKNNVFLMFDSENVPVLKSYLISFNLNINRKYVLTDTLGIYKNYLKDDIFNPRVVVVCENEVVYDKTYYPKELKKMDSVLNEFVMKKICE